MRYVRPAGVAANALVDGVAGESSTVPTAEEGLVRLGSSANQPILPHDMEHFLVERDGPLMPAFALDADRALLPVDVLFRQPGTLAGPNAGAVEQRQHGTIAQAQHRVRLGVVQQRAHLLASQRPGQLAWRRLDLR